MELKAVERTTAVADGGDGAGVGFGQGNEIAAHRGHLIAVAHPDDGFRRHVSEQAVALANAAGGPAEFTARRRFDLAAEEMASELHSVTDAEYGDAEIKQFGIAQGRAGSVDAGRAAGKDEAARIQFGDACGGQVVAHNLAKDVLFADAAGDELAVLRAEIEDQDAFTFGQC